MNIDGTNIRLLADVPEGQMPYIEAPTWSPDGRWILMEEGYVAGQDLSAPGTAGYLYVVPSEDLGKVFVLSIEDEKRSPEVIRFMHDLDGPGSRTMLTNRATGERYEWIP
ncbi:MAG: hypothetical protein ABW095_09065 [Candidatus Thiodiazotropha sp.]